jgi:hypothetical protein
MTPESPRNRTQGLRFLDHRSRSPTPSQGPVGMAVCVTGRVVAAIFRRVGVGQRSCRMGENSRAGFARSPGRGERVGCAKMFPCVGSADLSGRRSHVEPRRLLLARTVRCVRQGKKAKIEANCEIRNMRFDDDLSHNQWKMDQKSNPMASDSRSSAPLRKRHVQQPEVWLRSYFL